MPSQLYSLPFVTTSLPKAVYQFEFSLTPSYQHFLYIPDGTTIKNKLCVGNYQTIVTQVYSINITCQFNFTLYSIINRHLEIFNSSVSLSFPMLMSALSLLSVYAETYYEELGISIDVSNLFVLEEFYSNNYDQKMDFTIYQIDEF
ncbi:hypothetical protein RCL1_003224 [Eukaryota sp. TZLM3-RCL]